MFHSMRTTAVIPFEGQELKQFIDACVSSLARKSLHTRWVDPIEADDGITNGKDQEVPPEEKEEPSEEGTSKNNSDFIKTYL